MYDFTCEKCQHSLEIFQKMEDVRPTKCPKCKAKALIRIYNLAGISIDYKEPKTIGELAHANTEKMVKEGTLPKEALEYESVLKTKREKYSKRQQINKMSVAQKERYIFEGKM